MEEQLTEHEVITETVFSGDTVKTVRVTERTKGRNQISTQQTKREAVRVVKDTVVVERRDTIVVEQVRGQPPAENRRAPWLSALRWTVALIIALCVLIIIVKLRVKR